MKIKKLILKCHIENNGLAKLVFSGTAKKKITYIITL